MKTLIRTIALITLLGAAAPTFAGVRFGIDFRIGTPPPPPREVIYARPFVDAVWFPGYYNYSNRRYLWVPGRWDHQREFEGRRGERWENHDRDRDHGGDHDRGDRGDSHRVTGRIR